MKHPAFLLGMVALGLTLAFPAYATLLGSTDGSNLSSDTSALPIAMYTFNQGAPSSLNTTITGINTSLIRKYSNKFFYTDASGLERLPVGGTTPVTVKGGKSLELLASRGDLLVVSSASGSFTYDMKKGKASTFKPKVQAITSADLSSDGKILVMIAKNAKGMPKLFLSQGNASTVKEFPLPKGATSCTEISIEPRGKLAAVQCLYNTTSAIVIVTINGQTVGAMNKKIASALSPTTTEWMSDTTLIVGGISLNPATMLKEEYRSYTIKSGKVASTKNLAIDNSALIPAGATLSVPAQLLRISKTKFYYAFLSIAPSSIDPANSSVTSVIGMYDFTTKTNTNFVVDGMFSLLTEAPTSSS
jgi:hypothetical protein